MKSKVITGIALAMLLMGMLTLAFNIQQVKAELPLIFLDPSEYTAEVDEVFTIKVNVSDVTDLSGYDLWLDYNSTIIEHVNITVDGPGQVAPTNPAQRTITDVSVLGAIKFSCAFIVAMGAPPFNGSGTLAWITFNATNVGNSPLHFSTTWTELYNSSAEVIPSTPVDGSVTVFQKPVGGIWVPVDKLGLLAPYIALASAILVTAAATAIYVKRRKKRQ